MKSYSNLLLGIVIILLSVFLAGMFEEDENGVNFKKYYDRRSTDIKKKSMTKGKKNSPFEEIDSVDLNRGESLVTDTADDFQENDAFGELSDFKLIEEKNDFISEFETESFEDVETPDDYYQDLVDSYLRNITDALPEGRLRNDLIIRYYKHEDINKIKEDFKALRYYLHIKTSDAKKEMNNSLYYGGDVDRRDVYIVAYTLLKNNIPIKKIEESKKQWKSKAIEAAFIENNKSQTTLTIEELYSWFEK